MSKRLYLLSPMLNHRSQVIASGIDEHGTWVELAETIFHPQGGGQKSDRGQINGLEVVFVAGANEAVRHYLESASILMEGSEVVQRVDAATRSLHARLHSAGHLVAAIVEELCPELKAVAGHHWPGECRVEISGDDPQARDSLLERLQSVADAMVQANLPIQASGDGQDRQVAISEYDSVPCGGTHVCSTGELVGLSITGFKKKKGRFRLSYELGAKPPSPVNE
jgi:alanyl-tRNA synthetase